MDPHRDPFDGDEEAAIRYAIALSLQDHETPMPPSTSQKPVKLDSDASEDDDLESGPKCPPTPKKSTQDIAKMASTKSHPLSLPQATSQGVQPSGFAALGLDRKKMEEERLARAAKRKTPHDDEITEPRPQRPKTNVQPDNTPPLRISHGSASAQSPLLPYPKGVVKKTVSAYRIISYGFLLVIG